MESETNYFFNIEGIIVDSNYSENNKLKLPTCINSCDCTLFNFQLEKNFKKMPVNNKLISIYNSNNNKDLQRPENNENKSNKMRNENDNNNNKSNNKIGNKNKNINNNTLIILDENDRSEDGNNINKNNNSNNQKDN